jgi:hypothetical protein
MPNIIELTKAIVDTKTTAKVKIRNMDVVNGRGVGVALANADTGEFYKVIILGGEEIKDGAGVVTGYNTTLSDLLLDIVEKEIIKMKDFEGTQKPSTGITP